MSSCLKSTGAIINIGRGPGERTTVWVDVELEQLPNLVKIGQLRDAQITIKMLYHSQNVKTECHK